MASKCTKCGNTDNYNFALNIGLCDICIGEELERIKELEEKLEDWENSAKFVLGDDCPTDEVHCGCVVILKKRIKQLEALIKDVRNLINTKGHVSKWKIYNWLEQALKG